MVPEPQRVHWIWKLVAIVVPIGLGAALVAAALVGTRTVEHAGDWADSALGGDPPRLPSRATPARRRSSCRPGCRGRCSAIVVAAVAAAAAAYDTQAIGAHG